jgi:uncharacterized repeat protein (TIGR01451 family)
VRQPAGDKKGGGAQSGGFLFFGARRIVSSGGRDFRRIFRRIAQFLALLLIAAPAGAVFAAIGVNKTFSPTNVSAGQTSTLTVILLNSNASTADNTTFTDSLPASVVVASPANASTTCAGGSVSATTGNASFSFSGGSIPAAVGGTSGQCTVQVDVQSPTAGVYTNTIPVGGVSSSQGTNPQAAQATLTVAALASVTGTKTFNPTNVHGNGNSSTVTITLTNPNGVALTSASISDPMPSGLNTTAGFTTTTCGGTVTLTSTSAALSGGTIPANGSCNFTFPVIAAPVTTAMNANATNSIAASALTTTQGVTNSAFSNTIRVQKAASIAKGFSPSTIVSGGTSVMTVTINNFNASTISSIGFTDTLPGTMRIAASPSASTTCAGMTFSPVLAGGEASFTLTGGSLAGVAANAGITNTSCTVTVNVTATNAGSGPVTLTNSIAAGNFGGIGYETASGALIVNAASSVTGSKAFSPSTVLEGGSTTLTITLNNASASPANITAFTDNLNTLGAGFTNAGGATTTCGGAITATAGTTPITLGAGNVIPAGGNCKITAPINVAANAVTGTRTNTISTGAVTTDQGNNQAAITGTLAVTAVLTAAKAFQPTIVAAGTDTRLTISLTRAAGATSLSGLAFTDSLPSGFTVSSNANVVSTCGGTVTAVSGSGSISLSGGSLAGGAAATNCTIAVNVTTPSGVSSASNTIPIGGVTSTEGFSNPAAASASVAGIVTHVTVNKSFSPATVAVGGTSTMTINILNNNSPSIALTSGAISDSLPLGMVVATPPGVVSTCGASASVTAVAGSTSVSLSGASIAANATCSVQVNVKANIAGNLINTLPAGAFTSAQNVTNPVAASATLTATGNADISVTKTDGTTTAVPGGTTTYTIVVANGGPNGVAGLNVVDNPPAGMTITSWNCAATAGSSCTASGSGPINDLITLLNAGQATYTVNASIASSASGSIANTATAILPGSVVDSNLANNSATDTDTLAPSANLWITKTDGTASVLAGATTTYTIVASNAGPSDAGNAVVSDPAVAGLSKTSVSCVAAGGAVCPAGLTLAQLESGVAIPTFPAGGSITLTVQATVTAVGGSVTNTATIAAPAGVVDPNGTNNSASDTDTVTPVADLSITKTDGVSSVNAGTTTTYTIVVSNAGPSAANAATVSDPIASGLSKTSVSCVAANGASCPAGITVAQLEAGVAIPTLPAGGSITLTVQATVTASSGTVSNTASVSPPAGVVDTVAGNNSATDTDNVSAVADLSIVKSGPATVNAAAGITYTLTISNAGPSPANGATFTDAVPAGITSINASCGSASGGAVCPGSVTVAGNNVSGTIPTLPSGGSLVITINGTAPASGTLSNTGTVSPPSGTTDSNSGNNSSTVSTTVNPIADVSIVKAGPATVNAAGGVTYTLTISNAGPSAANGATFNDAVPAGITSINASCGSASGGSVCPGSVTVAGNNVSGTIPTLPSGGSLVITINGTAPASGTLSNTGTVSPPSGTTDSNSGNNSSTVSTTVNPIADLSITKTDGVSSVNAGTTTTYTIVVSNAGPSAANGAIVTDPAVSGLSKSSVSCVAAGGAACPAGLTVAQLELGVAIPTLPASGSITLTVQATVTATSGTVSNTATVSAPAGVTDSNSGNNSATDTDTVNPVADVSIVKAGPASVNAAAGITYTLTISNAGPSSANSATFSDAVPAGITSINASCGSASGGAVCPGSVTVAGNNVSGTIPTLPAGGSLVITVNGTAPSNGTTLSNTGTVSPPAGTTDSNSANNSSTVSTTVNPVADVSIVKAAPGSVNAAAGISYTLTIANAGPSPANGATFSDPVPAGITSINASCGSASGGAVCPASVTVAGNNVSGTIPALPAGGSLVITINGTAPAIGTTLSNTGTVSPPAGTTDSNSGNNASTVSTTVNPLADISLVKSGPATINAGTTITYTLTLSNAGPSSADGARFRDPVPAGITGINASCGSASGGAVCPGSVNVAGNNVSGGVPTLPAGGSVVITITGTVPASGTLVNSANSITPPGVTDPNIGNNSSSVTTTITPVADLSIVKSGPASVNAGATITYTLTIGNAGPSGANGATFSDPVPSGITAIIASCGSASGGAVCPGSVTVAGNNVSGTIPTLPAGGSLVITISGTAPASGTLANTATVAPPSGTTDPVLGNNTSTFSTNVVLVSNLSVTKDDGSATYTPGGSATYTIVVTNSGPSDALAVTVDDPLPAGVTLSANATCVASGTASCGSVTGTSGATQFGTTGASIPTGAANKLTFTAPVTFASGLTTDPLVNTVTASDPASPTKTASDSDTRAAQVTLAVVKTDGSANYTPGGVATYTITVTNAGPSDAVDVTVADALPAGVSLTAPVGCAAVGSASCGTVTGAAGGTSLGTTGATIVAGGGNALVFTAPVAFSSALAVDPLVNTATATDVATGATASGSDSDSRTLSVALAVSKTDGSTSYTPGGTATYTVTITNGGISDASSVMLNDPLPAGVSLTANATCVASGVANCGAVSGTTGQTAFGTTGAVIGAGGGNQLVFTAPVAFSAALTTDPLVNTASAIDVPSGSTGNATDSDVRSAQVTLAVTKTDGTTTYTPGGTGTYMITVANNGVSDALNVSVSDALPPGVTLAGNATCVASGVANCGAVIGSTGQLAFSATGATIAHGAGNLLTFTVPVAFAANLAADPLINTVTANDLASGASGSASDSDARAAQVVLVASKTDNSASYTPGGSAIYTITVGNNGVSDAVAVSVNDPLPTDVVLTGNASCVASGSANCGIVSGSAGQTAFGTTGASIAAGAGNLLTLSAPVTFAPGMTTNPLVNTASASDAASGASATASDSDTLLAQANLAVTKSDGSATYTPGGSAIYTIVVTNGGTSDALNVTVSDPLPAGVVLNGNATCVAAGGAICGSVVGSTGQTSFGATGARVNASAGSQLTFTVPVAFASSLATDPLVNTVTVSDPASPTVTASDSDARAVSALLAATKTDNSATYVPGGSAVYVIVVTNGGVSDATSVTVNDPLPAGVTLSANATCVATGVASCGTVTGTSGQTSFGSTGAMVGAGAGNKLTFSAPVAFSAALVANPLVNTVSVTSPSSPSASASDSDTRAASADLTIFKSGPPSAWFGTSITYKLTIGNNGPSAANGATFTDAVPAGVAVTSATCGSAMGGASCGPVTVSGNLVSGTIATLPVGGSVVITIVGQVKTNAAIVNTAQVSPPANVVDPTGANNASSVTTIVTQGSGHGGVPVPATSREVLLLLALVLFAVGMLRLRKSTR